MTYSRLSRALENGTLSLPEEGRIAVFNPTTTGDLSGLDRARVHAIQGFFSVHETLKKQGFDTGVTPSGPYTAALVFLPRAKAQARAMLAEAVAVTDGGLVIVDGQKTDGIEVMLKALRARVQIDGIMSKAHGKLIWFTGGDFSDWVVRDTQLEGDFITRPGVFSADAPDKGSQALLSALPAKLTGRGADLGTGWGYLARDILRREGVTSLDLVEADHTALECARVNIGDPRARFIWADVGDWGQGEGLNFVITNPPFHTGRKGDPDIGRAFIRAAAAMLAPNGQLWMVANRHLPYEADLQANFRHVNEAGGNAGFKILHAIKPRRNPLPHNNTQRNRE